MIGVDLEDHDDGALRAQGGVRDLFNFGAVANHLTGAVSTRRRADGSAIHPTAFYNSFTNLPGEDPTKPFNFVPGELRFADLVDAPSVRYGNVDATPGMMKGTSPSIAALPNGGFEVAFQANTTSLWTVGSAGNTDWQLRWVRGRVSSEHHQPVDRRSRGK